MGTESDRTEVMQTEAEPDSESLALVRTQPNPNGTEGFLDLAQHNFWLRQHRHRGFD